MNPPPPGRHVLWLIWRDTGHPLGGGSETYAENVAEQLCARGYRVTILCAHYPGAPRQENRGQVTFLRRGGRFAVYARAALLYLAGAVGFGPLSRRRLGRPDVIIDTCNGLPFLTPLYARVPIIAMVYHVHREQWRIVMGPKLARLGWWIESWLAPRVYRRRRYVTISEASRKDLVSLGIAAERIQIVHCGTPPVTGAPVPRDTYPHIVALARLVPHKRLELALRSLAELGDEVPGLRLTIAGQGWWEPNLRQLVDELGIGSRVDFAGHVTEETKHELFSRAWVTLVPSLKEGWGLTIVEAGARSTPTVAMAAGGGVAEAVLDEQTGLLATDDEHFVASVRSLLQDDERREAMGVLAAKHALSFTWEQAAIRFDGIIAEVVAEASR